MIKTFMIISTKSATNIQKKRSTEKKSIKYIDLPNLSHMLVI